MKQALIRKYMKGESSCHEERELKRLLQNIPESERNGEEQAILRLLSATGQPEEKDIFNADFTAEYDRAVSRRRMRRLLPWAAACAASIVALLFIPLRPHPEQTLSQVPATQPVQVAPTPPCPPAEETVTPAPLPQPAERERPRVAKAKAEPPVREEQEPSPSITPTPEEVAAVEQQLSQVLEEERMMEELINEVITNTYQQPISTYTL